MPTLTTLPPEVILKISAYLPHSSLVHLCTTSQHFHALTLPLLYATLEPGSAAGSLRLFRALSQDSSSGYIGQYASQVRGISIPKIAATPDVKEAIALAVAECINKGYLPALRELRWPFTYVRRQRMGIMQLFDACAFDEPLWEALAAAYPEFDTLIAENAWHVAGDSPLWSLESRCKTFKAPRQVPESHDMTVNKKAE